MYTASEDTPAPLRESGERYRSLFERLPVGLYRSTPDGRLLDANPALVALLGYPDRESLLAQPVEAFYASAEDRAAWLETLDRDGVAPAFEIRNRRYDGALIWVRDSGGAVHGPDGSILFYEGVLEDVTARREAEEKIRFQANLLDMVGQAVVSLDMEGRVVSWNRGAERLYGWTRAEAVGRSAREVLVPDEEGFAAEEVFARLRAGEAWSGEFRVRHRDGHSFPVMVTDTPVFDAEGRQVGVVGVSADLTERRQLEEQLRQSQKMEAVGRLAGGVAHDFNNLLTAIKGNTEILLADLPPASPLREELQEISRASDRAARLTRQLLAFSRRQVLQPRVLDLNATLAEMEKMLRRVIGEDVELVLSLDPELGYVEADPGQVEQVLVNLVVNAREAMPTGGRLEVATRSAPAGESGGRVCMTVRDTGVGMDEATLARAFEPFFTTKEEGSGLGLSTVYGIVEQSGGRVRVESAPGKGTAFHVHLPEARSAAPAPPPPAPAARAPRGAGSVLLVEDEDSVRLFTSRLLERGGYTVLQAGDAAAALELLHGEAAGVDLLLTDVVMPRMSGRVLAERALALRPGLRVLYMSGYTDDALARHGVLEEGVHLIEKPFAPEALLARVHEVLGRAPASELAPNCRDSAG